MTDVGLWWLALGLGLVVIVVAVVLLQVFLREVHRIERHARQIWQAGKDVAANTATTWQLQQTVSHADAILDEVQRHVRLLEGDPTTAGAERQGEGG